MPERKTYRVKRHRTGPRSEQEVVHSMALRLLSNQKHTQEALEMEVDQVVYEYGKLHLNFVACQRSNAMLATQLAQANKNIATITADANKSAGRIAQLEAWAKEQRPSITFPEVPKEPEPEGAEGLQPPNPGTAVGGIAGNEALQTGVGSRVVKIPHKRASDN
jgi:hypothetical protein